jgi:peptidoglycan/LPS O-acetylase OafA/YrhL
MEHSGGPILTPVAATKTARPKIHALTSARFFAALYVVFFHTRWGVAHGSVLDRIFALGYVAPYFFFLLSGYILAMVYLRQAKTVAAKRFYVARFARIYPLYIVSVLADVPFAVVARTGHYGLKVAAERVAVLFSASVVMMQMWLPTLTIVNIPSWSLSIETIFYLSFPLAGPWLWRLPRRALVTASVLLFAVSVALSTCVIKIRADHPSGFDLISFLCTFSLGILLARWQFLREDATHAETRVDANAEDRNGWLVLALTAMFFAIVVAAHEQLRGAGINCGYLLIPVYMGTIWWLAATRIPPVRWLESKWLVVLGEASYGLYLIQLPVAHLFTKLGLTGSAWNYPLYLSACIGLSVASFYYFETPARKWILRRFASPTKETMEAASAAQ